METSRSGQTNQGLARIVSHAAKAPAARVSSRDSRRASPPTPTTSKHATTRVTVAPMPKAPVRSHWSATSPIATTDAKAAQPTLNLTLALAQAGSGAAAGS